MLANNEDLATVDRRESRFPVGRWAGWLGPRRGCSCREIESEVWEWLALNEIVLIVDTVLVAGIVLGTGVLLTGVLLLDVLLIDVLLVLFA